MNASPPTVYAIDFGTSNSLLAAANADRVFDPVALDAQAVDPTVLRSILYFPEIGDCRLGVEGLLAYGASGMEGRLVRSLKRFLPNRSFTHTRLAGRRYRLEELIATLLRAMRERADAAFGTEVRSVLLGRPVVYSSDAAEDAFAESRMREAAQIAGFEDIAFCPEPLAAARDLASAGARVKTILIADLGGGTSDFCLVRMGEEPFSAKDVLAVGGVSVAGDALDGALMRKELSRHFGAEVRYRVPFGSNTLTMPSNLIDMLCTPARLSLLSGTDVKSFIRDIKSWSLSDAEAESVQRLLVVAEDGLGFQIFEAVERTKLALSSSEVAPFVLDYPEVELEQAIARAAFEAASAPSILEIVACLDGTLATAGVTPEQVDLVCLTGGTSQVPAFFQQLLSRFDDSKLQRLKGFHSVVGGLARQAQLLARG